jgi:hypothetical protein
VAITGSQKAYKYALSGVLRSGSGRSNYTDSRVYVSIGGTQYATGRATPSHLVLAETLTIAESQGQPSTADFRVQGFQPTVGQEVIITLGSRNSLDRQIAGNILTVSAGYTGTPANAFYDVHVIDYSWQFTRRRITKRYSAMSATDIVIDLVSQVPGGFTTHSVSMGLATIDEMSFTFDTIWSAITQVANRIGAAPPSVNYLRDVHFAMTAASDTNPVAIVDGTVPTLTSLTIPSDLGPVITRAFEGGGGSNALAPASAGDTVLAVENVVWYSDVGGFVICGPQQLAYTGIADFTGGSLVGPGTSPAAAPAAVGKSGSGITAGEHEWAFTYVTGAGESLPSPLSASVSMRTLTTPNAIDSIVNYGSGPGGVSAGTTVQYALSVSTSPSRIGESTLGTGTSLVSDGTFLEVRFTYTLDMIRLYVNVYRNDNGAGYKLVNQFGPVAVSSVGHISVFTDGVTSASSSPISGGNTIGQAAVSGIAIGPSGTLSRNVYRTAAGGTQLKLQSSIADNTTTTLTDTAADGSLGANAPTSDTSGLTQPSGQVLAGSTSMTIAGAGPFPLSGFAVIGNGQQVIRYTGVTDNTLTGIPPSGNGAIISTVIYGSSITPAPMLVGIPASGIGSIQFSIAKGDQVNLLVQVDDLTAQATVIALVGGDDDGVIEDYQNDGRISLTEAAARATATLEAHSAVVVGPSGTSFDNNMRGGRTLPINITHPTTVNASFSIQSVTTSNFQTAMWPTRAFQAASMKFGFSDFLRIARNVLTGR